MTNGMLGIVKDNSVSQVTWIDVIKGVNQISQHLIFLQVSLEFSPSAAVPGEENRLQLRAQPDSLCGISAVDQSVLIKEPGKKLNADKASWAA